jgi:phosphoserine aminotransferase
MARIYNFSAGPASMPEPVLEEAARDLLELPESGMSVMEMSHRSKKFESILAQAESGVKNLLGLPDNYHVLFLQGGASLQFAMAPLNLLLAGERADYILTDQWSQKALKEADKVAKSRGASTRVAASTESEKFARIPRQEEISFDDNAAFAHITTNNTLFGTQWKSMPSTRAPIVADASSDILSRPLEIEKYGLIYAGAQKNIGPSGVTVVIVRRDLIESRPHLPIMLSYATHAKERSLYNTPNTFGIYMVGHVCEWIESLGGLEGMARRSEEKAGMLYETIDASDFYHGFAARENRSQMNVTFRLPSEELEKKFAAQSEKEGMIGLKGHRSVGGLRASIYNALEPDSVRVLVEFMREFERQNG